MRKQANWTFHKLWIIRFIQCLVSSTRFLYFLFALFSVSVSVSIVVAFPLRESDIHMTQCIFSTSLTRLSESGIFLYIFIHTDIYSEQFSSFFCKFYFYTCLFLSGSFNSFFDSFFFLSSRDDGFHCTRRTSGKYTTNRNVFGS